MKYLKLFNERFNISITEKDIEEWGITIEDLEDILIELSDHSWGPGSEYRGSCKINKSGRPLKVKYSENGFIKIKTVPNIIILAEVYGMRNDINGMINRIKNSLDSLGIDVSDTTMDHSRTKPEENVWFTCLRLIKKSDIELMKAKSSYVING